jgi:hypothetical protein
MAFNVGSITATLGIDTSGFEGGMLRAQSVIGAFGPAFGLLVTSPVLAGVQALGSLGRMVVRTADELMSSAESLGVLSAQTGASVETIQALQRTLSLAGLSAEGAADGLLFLSRQVGDAAMGGKAAQEAFSALGLGFEDVATGERAVRSVIEALSKLPDEATRNELAVRLLGRSAGPMLATAMREGAGGIERMIGKLDQMGVLLRSGDVGELERLDATIDDLKLATEGLRVGLVREFIAGFSDAGDSAASIGQMAQALQRDLLPAARAAGEAMNDLGGWIKEVIDGLKALKEFASGDTLAGRAASGIWDVSMAPLRGARWAVEGAGDLMYGNPFGATRRRVRGERSRGRQP